MADQDPNTVFPGEQPEWNSKGAWVLPGWAEPVVSVQYSNHRDHLLT